MLFRCVYIYKIFFIIYIVVAVQSLSCAWFFVTPWTVALQASLSFTISQSLLKFKSIELVMPSNHLIHSSSVTSFSHPQSFLASGSFSMSQLFASYGQSFGGSVSASVLPMNIQDWSPLVLIYVVCIYSYFCLHDPLLVNTRTSTNSALHMVLPC